MAKSTADQI